MSQPASPGHRRAGRAPRRWAAAGVLLLALSACAPIGFGAGSPVPTPPAILSAPELGFWQLHQPEALEGQRLQLMGLYRRFDTSNRVLDVCHVPQPPPADGAYRLPCDRFPLDRELGIGGPATAELLGVWRQGRLELINWQATSAPAGDIVAACRSFFRAHSGALGEVEWGQIARPDYAESSNQYSLLPADLETAPAELQGYDRERELAVVRFAGPDMPVQRPQVHRAAVVYCVGDAGPPFEVRHAVATIEGWVEE
jgi:hypothetical protein